jgi:four helix bundle protein
MRDYTKLKIWQKSHQLTLEVYSVSKGFPKAETYGLTSQMRRSCSSIPANIVEGCGRGGETELNRYIIIAMGSANELEYHLLLARDLGYLEQDGYCQILKGVKEVKQMLTGCSKRLKKGV